jgi:release factor glutamine methyltransferase
MSVILNQDRLDCLTLLRLIKRKLPRESSLGNFQDICKILLAEILKKNYTQLYLENPTLSRGELKTFKSYLESVLSDIPLSFIFGKTFFFGLEFHLDEHCFIPRPETEILVEKVRDIAGSLANQKLLIFDLCTGIGNIAISLTKFLSYCKIMATDISHEALKFARKNAFLHEVDRKIDFVCCDLTSSINKRVKADIIVSNPPYIKSKEIQSLPENVKQEPRLALEGGVDGLSIIRRLFEISRFFLKEKGFLIFEFGDTQKDAIEKIAEFYGIFKTIEIIKDYNGLDRIFIGRKRH